MPAGRGSVLLATVLGSGMVFLDGTIVNVALETIGQELPSTVLGRLEGLTYVTSGYLAILAALLILAGAMGDRYGRRRVFGIGLVGFGVTSVACGLAPTLELLVVARLVQGAAGALLVPGLARDHHRQLRRRGAWPGDRPVGGRDVGGHAARARSSAASSSRRSRGGRPSSSTCRSSSSRCCALRDVPESRDETASGHFDWLGAAVIALAVGGLAFGATRGQQREWQDPIAWVALAVGAVGAGGLPVPHGSTRSHPLVPLAAVPLARLPTINLSTLRHLRRALHDASRSRPCSCRARSATRRWRPVWRACRSASC